MLARSGASLVIVSRTESDLKSLKEQVNSINGHEKGIKTIQADIGKIEDCQRIIKEAGPIDLLVNNAGICNLAPFIETTAESFEKHMNVNVRGPMLIAQGVAKGMIGRKQGGSIVNISSQASKIGLEEHTAYCVSKGALDQLTRMMKGIGIGTS
eukprot:TRINITY_DN1887_c0_g1_i1.p1 TRINITY_DN1887_c0_g1~~TRINITY_DN1887_c0_g1_i1.p1  ORF type:complete len:154 (-),score=29.02 TRINITY_DN1887_c0_g1_i1:263-724(-)